MKLKHCLSLFLFIIIPVLSIAQTYPVTITHERSAKGDVTFYANNVTHAPYTVALTFTRLSGTLTYPEGETQQWVARPGKSRLVTLKPASENTGIGFAYRSNLTKGDFRAKTDTDFVYIFPLTEGKKVRINQMNSLDKTLGKEERTRLTGIAFQATEGDTIVAARRGVVTEVQDHSASKTGHKRYSASENYVEIYHKDGTFARYKLFLDDGIFVSPGDYVIPGQPIGIIGGSNYEQGSHLRFSIFCPDKKDFTFVPYFYLSPAKVGKPVVGELYVSEHPIEFIVKEMSKKERKKFEEKKK